MAASFVKNCLGVDIGTHNMRVAQVEMGKAGPRVVRLVEEPIEHDPTLSEAKRSAQLAKQLQQLLKKNKIRTKHAVFAVPGQSVFVRTFKLPKAAPESLPLMARFEARQQIPFPLDKTRVEYQFFEEPGAPDIDVLLVAIRNDYIENFMRFIEKTGLRSVGISVSTLALYNFQELNNSSRDLLVDEAAEEKKKEKAQKSKGKGKKSRFKLSLGKKKKGDESAGEEGEDESLDADEAFDSVGFDEIQAYVNLGHTLMDIAIPKTGFHKMLGFPRSVPVAGSEMDRAIRAALDLESADEARRIKENETAILSTEFEIEGDADSVNMPASEAVTKVADKMVAEIRRSLDYYISQPDGVAVDSIVLSGGLARLKFITSYLEEKLGIPVTSSEPKHEQLRMPDDIQPGELAAYAVSVGLAFQGLGLTQNKIDFLPEEAKAVLAMRGRKGEVGVMAAMITVVVLLNFGVGETYTAHNRQVAEQYASSITRLSKESEKIQDAESRQAKILEAYQKAAKAAGWRDWWLEFLTIFFAARPADVLVDQLELDPDGTVNIIGVSPKQSSISNFIEDIKGITYDGDYSEEGKKLTVIGEASLVDLRERRDSRFPGQTVYSYEVRVKTRVRDGRLRPIGEAPVDLEAQRRQQEQERSRPGGMLPGIFRPGGGDGQAVRPFGN